MIGAAASAAWAQQHGLDVSRTPHWDVEISVPTDSADTLFEINIYPEEWGVVFRRGNRVSSMHYWNAAMTSHSTDRTRRFEATWRAQPR